jgi:aryl carrier-like protein
MPTNSGNIAAGPPSRDELRAAVATIIGAEPEAIGDDANLLRLGVDSLGMMRLVNHWRREGIRVSSRELAADPTLAGWHRCITALYTAARNERVEGE